MDLSALISIAASAVVGFIGYLGKRAISQHDQSLTDLRKELEDLRDSVIKLELADAVSSATFKSFEKLMEANLVKQEATWQNIQVIHERLARIETLLDN